MDMAKAEMKGRQAMLLVGKSVNTLSCCLIVREVARQMITTLKDISVKMDNLQR
jgi:hypothetical protein